MNRIIEIRTLNLKPGRREEFKWLYIEQALPLLKHCNFDVVVHGPALHDENTLYPLVGDVEYMIPRTTHKI